jgi:hypothetical protein
MSRKLIFGLVLCATAVTGCGGNQLTEIEPSVSTVEEHGSNEANASTATTPVTDEDNAAETLSKMLKAAKEGDWEAYVEFYGEQDKFRSPADRDALVKRFEEKWGDKVVEGLSRAVEFPVQIDGDKAMFQDGQETLFILYKNENGDWTFHL